MVQDTLNRWFALIIAQLLPGLLIVFGLSFHSPAVSAWLGTAAAQTVTLAGTLLVVLTAVSCGLVLSGARFLFFERLLKVCGSTAALDVSQRLTTEPTYQNLVAQHYAYYQFYGSTFIAAPTFALLWRASVALEVTWTFSAMFWTVGAGAMLVLLEVILWYSACDAFDRFEKKRSAIYGAPGLPATVSPLG